eukprot:2647030-Amphidinium_carterae.2
MEVTHFNDVKVYNLSSGKSLPAWLKEAEKKKVSLKYNEDYRKRIDLLQDFEFSVASSRVKIARDGQHIIATGIYPPEMRIFDARELGMKHNRRMDAEIVDFHILSDDWKKIVFLQDDRHLEFHAQGKFRDIFRGFVPVVSTPISRTQNATCNLLTNFNVKQSLIANALLAQFLAWL